MTERQISNIEQYTEKMLNSPAIREGGFYPRIVDGVVYPGTYAGKTVAQEIYEALSLGYTVRDVGGGYVVSDNWVSPRIYKFRFLVSLVLGDVATCVKGGAISHNLADLVEYFGVEPPKGIGDQCLKN